VSAPIHIRPDHEPSSGDVFADLGPVAPAGRNANAEAACRIADTAAERRPTRAQTARMPGTTQSKVSELFAGKLAGFSVESPIRVLNACGQGGEIRFSSTPRGRDQATLRVSGRARSPRRRAARPPSRVMT
jgi:predicted XRE-type DNA-binding protein